MENFLELFIAVFFGCFHYPLLIFTTVFGVFSIFNTDFYHCFSFVSIIDCICLCHQLVLPWLISSCSFIASATDLGIFFNSQTFFTLRVISTFTTVPQMLRIWDIFYSQTFTTYHYKCFPQSWQFFFEG